MDFAAALMAENQVFGELIRGADPDTPVPTCPGWTIKQLFRHVGRGQRWSAQIITDRVTDGIDPRLVRDGKPPEDVDGAIAWLHGGARAVIDAVDQVGPDTDVWTFLGPRPAAWWIRRRTHEVVVHRADAALALGADYQLPAELAADGIAEWLEIMAFGPQNGAGLLDVGQTLGLRATDSGDRWLLVADEGGLTLSRESADGSATVSGPAADLLMAVTRRVRTEDGPVIVAGDGRVWQTWLERTAF